MIMVRIATFAFLFLFSATATAKVAGNSHRGAGHRLKRSSVCKPRSRTSTVTSTSGTPTAVVAPNATKSRFATITKTSTSVKATQSAVDSSNDDSGSNNDTSVSALFPMAKVSHGWTVADGDNTANIKSISLGQNTFIVTKETKTSIWDVGQYQGKTAVKTTFNKGSLDPGSQPSGGFSYYTPGVRGSSSDIPLVDLTKGTELMFTYSIYFEPGFDFNLGGKLPGLYGGTDPDVAATCSGGRHDPDCWSARLMFRPDGDGELYLYIPPGLNDNDNKCGKKANTKCETSYGESVGRGTWNWTPGKWQTISQRILLNTPGKADGEAEIYLDGDSVLKVDAITWRSKEAAVTRGIEMQTFFGGHEAEWASPKTQDAYFADFSVAIVN